MDSLRVRNSEAIPILYCQELYQVLIVKIRGESSHAFIRWGNKVTILKYARRAVFSLIMLALKGNYFMRA